MESKDCSLFSDLSQLAEKLSDIFDILNVSFRINVILCQFLRLKTATVNFFGLPLPHIKTWNCDFSGFKFKYSFTKCPG